MSSQSRDGQGGSGNGAGHEETRTEGTLGVSTAGPSVSQVPMQVVRLEDLQGTVDALVAKALDKGSPVTAPAGGESPSTCTIGTRLLCSGIKYSFSVVFQSPWMTGYRVGAR